MDHNDPVKSASGLAVDPVCGMKVDPATAKFSHQHKGKAYFFCCGGCREKFNGDPEKFLSSPPKAPKPMGSGLVSLGMAPPTTPTMAPAKPVAIPSAVKRDTRAYVCPMCPEVRQAGPGPCPKCGMALEPESPVLPATKTEYTCPMHPEIVQAGARELSDLWHGP